MFGNLPARYELTVWVTGLVLFGALGAWLTTSPSVALVWRVGVLIGVAVGIGAVALFSRLMSEPRPAARRL